MTTTLLYGTPAPGLVDIPTDAVQVSPLIPGAQDLAAMADASVAEVVILAPGGTHVRLTHSGWDQFEDRERETLRGGMGRAWHTVALPALKAVAEGAG